MQVAMLHPAIGCVHDSDLTVPPTVTVEVEVLDADTVYCLTVGVPASDLRGIDRIEGTVQRRSERQDLASNCGDLHDLAQRPILPRIPTPRSTTRPIRRRAPEYVGMIVGNL